MKGNAMLSILDIGKTKALQINCPFNIDNSFFFFEGFENSF